MPTFQSKVRTSSVSCMWKPIAVYLKTALFSHCWSSMNQGGILFTVDDTNSYWDTEIGTFGRGQKMHELLFFFSVNTSKFCCYFICDAATNHTPRCLGQWGQEEVSAVQEGRSQRGDSAAVHETVNRRHTHKVGKLEERLAHTL